MKCSICESKYKNGKMLFLNLNKSYCICENCINKVINKKKYGKRTDKEKAIAIKNDFTKIVEERLKKYV